MPFPRRLELSADARAELVALRDTGPKSYLRERAAAVAAEVARTGLLRPRQPDTVYVWLDRYREHGIAGLTIRPGRGRKPAFSPSLRDGR